ncbi:MAG: cytochrome c [Gemmatimonadota bacterium]
MGRTDRARRLALVLVVALGGCQVWYDKVPSPDDLMHAIPWFNAMIGSPAVYPYSTADVPRYTVPGTVPVTGGEADYEANWRAGKTIEADALSNPTDRRPSEVGDTTFHVFCAPCHGMAGAGDGIVGKKMGAPSIVTDKARGFSDGYLYSMIRYGRGVMPRYGDKIFDPARRWAAVNYVRWLQAQGMPAAPAAPAARGATR